MTVEQRAVAGMAQLAMILCIVGLVRSGRWRMCYGLLAYALAILALGAPTTWGPDYFRTWRYWTIKQTVYDAVKLALATELAIRMCRHFPGARTRLERWLLAVLLLTAAGLLLRPWSPDMILMAAGELHARAVIGTLWLLVASLVAAHHFRLAVHPHHMGILLGFAVYLAVWGILLRLMIVDGWAAYWLWNALDPPAYVTFSVWLAWVSWRRDTEAAGDYEAVVTMLRQRAV